MHRDRPTPPVQRPDSRRPPMPRQSLLTSVETVVEAVTPRPARADTISRKGCRIRGSNNQKPLWHRSRINRDHAPL